jgi:acetyltransferase-like isoleucine patch superfamily enzyme
MKEIKRLRGRSPFVIVQLVGKILPMFLRGLWLKTWLKRSEGLILIGRQVAVHNPQYISIGRNFVAEDYCEIQGLSKNGIAFGEHVTIGRFAMIRPSGYYGREVGVGLRVGNFSNIGPYCYIGCSGLIEIGNNVLMAPRVSLFAENHNFDRLDVTIMSQGVSRSSIIIEDDCWLASNSIILAGVSVGHGSVIAAGSVVTKNVEPYSIMAGIPARVIGYRGTE